MADHQEALTRLTRWRDAGSNVGMLIAADSARHQFCTDVSALLDLVTWRPISEAPRDGTSVMTFPHFIVTHWEDGGWVDGWDEGEECWKHIRHTVTHFMPIPPAPATEAPHDR